MLNRLLLDKEVVHHINENKYDNREDNLMVFSTNGDHSRFHKGYKELIKLDNGAYICTYATHICELCGSEFVYTDIVNKYCSPKCAKESLRKVDRPSKEILLELLSNNTFTHVGRIYGVSDNAVRKWCKSYGLSTKAKDYIKV